MANGNCQCNGDIDKLICKITCHLQALNIFDIGNVFVCCLDLQIANNTISILNLNSSSSCINCSGQPFEFNQIVSSAGVYVVVGNSQRLECNSNIIYIGSSGNLNDRINNFIRSLERIRINNSTTSPQTPQNIAHSGVKCIGQRLLYSQNTQPQGCLYIVGFPIKTNIPVQIAGQTLNAQLRLIGECIAKIAEACFLDTYKTHYKGSPCCVERAPSCDDDYYKCLNSSDPSQAQKDIQKILETINSIFQSCIQNC